MRKSSAVAILACAFAAAAFLSPSAGSDRTIRGDARHESVAAAAPRPATAQTPRKNAGQRPRTRAQQRKPARPDLPCGNAVAFQVLLDRAGFSPGQIDTTIGNNAGRALAAFQNAHALPSTGGPDCDTWHALGGETSGPTIVVYQVTEADLKGPFTSVIPRDLDEQAKLRAMSYRSSLEQLSERFHVAPALLRQMNPKMTLRPGEEIQVPAVTPFDAEAKPPRDQVPPDITIQVSRDESALRATRGDNRLIFFAPVSSGSVHDPLPVGDWCVRSVDWHPVFHYNPKLFWDAKPSDEKATIKSGPRNPVGVVWIGLTIEHYGLHGSPEPSHIGHTESHGCVRLTNWDATRVASLVKPGTAVLFR